MKDFFSSRWMQAIYLGLLVGLVVFVWIWRVRAGSPSPFDGAVFAALDEWGQRLTSFAWIERYQTAIGGGLAALAGATVLLTTRMQITEARLHAERQRRDAIVAALAAFKADFTRARLRLVTKVGGPIGAPLFETSRAQLPTIYAQFHYLGEHLHILMAVVEAGVHEVESPSTEWRTRPTVKVRAALAAVIAAHFYFNQVSLLVDRTGTQLSPNVDPARVLGELQAQGLTVADMPPSGKWLIGVPLD